MDFDVYITPTISVVELFVVFIGLVGFVSTGRTILDAVGDRKRLRRAGKNGSRKRIANGNVREEAQRGIILFLFIIAGMLSMIVKPPAPPINAMVATAIRFIILSVEVMAVAGSLAAYYDRLRLRDDWNQEERLASKIAANLSIHNSEVLAAAQEEVKEANLNASLLVIAREEIERQQDRKAAIDKQGLQGET